MAFNLALLVRSASLSAIAIAVACPVPALAQSTGAGSAEAQAPETRDAPAEEAIVVTGTRIQAAGFTAPTPTTVIGEALLQERGASSIAQVLNEMPAFAPTTSTATAGSRPFAPGANWANLRSLGPTRTLTLVDGRRFVPSVPTFGTAGAYSVDMNLIPPIILKRAEVVTGGASAQWGSDAVAGVVNLIIDNKFEGLKFDAEAGISELGDNSEQRLAGMVGTRFAGGRGSLVFAGEYYRNGGVGDAYTRDWGRREAQVVANPSVSTNGRPAQIIAENTRTSTFTPGGLVNAGPLRGLQFLPGGATSQYQYGDLVGTLLMVGGGAPEQGLAKNVLLVPTLERYSLFGHGEFDLGDSITLFLEGSYGFNKSDSFGQASRDTALTIDINNPFLPASVRTQMVNAGVTNFRMGRVNYDFGMPLTNVTNRNYRFSGGARGDLGGSWRWDASAQYGENDYRQTIAQQRVNDLFNLAVDAVAGPNGTVVCRSTLTSPNNGCVPLNLFGEGAPSAAALNYILEDGTNRTRYRQFVTAANVQGEPLSTWAGPVSVALGIEHRRERQNTIVDAIANANRFNFQNPRPLQGRFEVTEGYLETLLPLARDTAWAKRLDLSAAVRYANYSSVGDIVTWKIGGTYEINDTLMLRATRSRDIRAPNLFERFAQPSVTRPNISDPFTNTQLQVSQALSGTPGLREERADTFSAGGVFSPDFISGLQLSVDYYRIKLNDAIVSISAQSTVTLCFQTRDPFFCNNIVRNTAGAITNVLNPYVNLGSLTTEGIDVELAQRIRLGSDTLNLRAVGTYTLKALSDNGFGAIDRAGEVGQNNLTSNPMPRFRGLVSASYETGPFRGFAQVNFISRSVYDSSLVEGVGVENGNIPAFAYLNVGATFSVGEANKYQFFFNVDNLLDQDPPNVPTLNFLQPTNAAYYDVIGRRYKAGVRIRM